MRIQSRNLELCETGVSSPVLRLIACSSVIYKKKKKGTCILTAKKYISVNQIHPPHYYYLGFVTMTCKSVAGLINLLPGL